MNFKFWKKGEKVIQEIESPAEPPQQRTKSSAYIGYGKIGYNPIIDDNFDGEKTPGELGAVLNTTPDYLRLRLRAYDLNLKTDIIKVITGKFFKWVIGSGLKLQSEPSEHVLKMFNISIGGSFKKDVESLFELYAASEYSDYHEKDNLHQKGSDAFNNSFLGGDCLCVVRVGEFGPNMQVIDGQQVQTPFDDKDKVEGNVIKHGIEMSPSGRHEAFWVAVDKENAIFEHKRIPAYNKNGNKIAWMVYGNKERIDHHRGIPYISSILEKVSKLDRFVEASVKKAEETANVVYAFEHDENSTGENILTQSLSSKKTDIDDGESAFEVSERTAAMVRQSTSSMVLNMTPGSKLVSLSNPNETTFNEFFRAVFVTLCASVDIPEEVALQKYEQNYSSSRAAINGWEHIVEIYRQKFSDKFYKPFYKIWLEWMVLTDQINAAGFLELKNKKNMLGMEAYFKARFTGKKMPHIDPLKEAKAIRAMLGDDNIALISREQAAENLGAGDWEANYLKSIEEEKIIPKDKLTPKEDVKTKNNQQQPGVGSGAKK